MRTTSRLVILALIFASPNLSALVCEARLAADKHALQDAAAEQLGLHDSDPNKQTISRTGRPGRFVYLDANGESIQSSGLLDRIRQIKVRPDLRHVKISQDALSRIQAVGYDRSGRPQYTYHPLWLQVRATVKAQRLPLFAKALPAIRAKVRADLNQDGWPDSKLLAMIVRLLDDTRIRVGNEDYAEENGSFGLTTLLKTHVQVNGTQVTFSFPGKSHVFHTQIYPNAEMAKWITELLKLPGDHLFLFEVGPEEFSLISSARVNEYIKEISGGDFSAKDFRTWWGTVFAAENLHSVPYPQSKKEMMDTLQKASVYVASKLENTPKVSRDSYIDPTIFKIYGENDSAFEAAFVQAQKNLAQSPTGRSLAEEATLILLTP